MDRKRRKTHIHTERERESCGYIYNPREAIEKWLKDGQKVRRFNGESVRKRPLIVITIVMEKDDDITAAAATCGGDLDEDIEDMQEMEEDAECDESGTESDEGDEEEGKFEKNIRRYVETI